MISAFNERMIASTDNLPELVRSSLEQLPGKSTLLDIGAGDGRMARAMGYIDSTVHVVGVEYDQALCQTAQRNNPGLCLITADAHRLPFASESFDTVTYINTLHEVVDQPSKGPRLGLLSKAVIEASRVLRPGGALVIYDGIMPPDSEKDVVVTPNSSAAHDMLQRFGAEYLAKQPVLGPTNPDSWEITSNLATVTTYLTKYNYLKDGEAWEGERHQLYPFATTEDITKTLQDSSLHIKHISSPPNNSRKGLEKLLQEYQIHIAESGEPYTIDNFPACQALTLAIKN